MAISLRLSDEEDMMIKKYAELHGMTVSELVRKAVFERIEDEYDLKTYEEAIERFQVDPVTYSLDEVERELDLK